MSSSQDSQSNKANAFKQLHHQNELLILPNIWDPLGAQLLEKVGYPALATASASIAFCNGYPDGERIPFDDVVSILKKIVDAVNVPITADIESGYAKNKQQLAENIKRLIDTGIAGVNIEDTLHGSSQLRTGEDQSERIHCIRTVASSMGIPLFINARTDVYLRAQNSSSEEKLEETIRRGKIYKDAGADGFYPMIVKTEKDIATIVRMVELPVNILLLPDIPDFPIIKQLGIARLSLGPGFLKIALNAMKTISEKLLRFEGMEEVKNNPLNTSYINSLINKTHEKNQHFTN